MSILLLREYIRTQLYEHVRQKFAMELPVDLLQIASQFKSAGHVLYVVGGSIRDALQGKEPKDYDVATDAVPDKVIQILEKDPELKILEIGKSFGVVKVVTPEGNEYEIATFRQDIGKGRRPDAVEFTSIENDVMRRDLTINALFYDIDAGEIVDYVGGMEDIKNGVVRAVGDAKERFDEDRLRILRALRFAARMGSSIDSSAAKAISADNSLKGVSPERIRDEFLKGVKAAKDVLHFFNMIEEFNLWPQIMPGLNVIQRYSSVRDVPVMLALLLDANEPQLVSKRLNALKYSATECAQTSFLLQFKNLDINNAVRLKKLATSCHISDNQLETYALEHGTPSQNLVRAFIQYQPTIRGDDLMAQGYSGAALGKELEKLERELFSKMVVT